MILRLIAALHDHEQRLADAMDSGIRLAASASEAQRAMTARLGYLGGHQIIGQITEAQSGLAKAMSSTAEGHRKLTQLGALVGYKLDEGSGFGDGQKDPTIVAAMIAGMDQDHMTGRSAN